MKTSRNILLVFMASLALLACEKNDPIPGQGTLTGNITPFNLLAQMPDAKVTDTLMLRTVCWAKNDDINSVAFYYRGFKIKSYSVKMGLVVNNQPVTLTAEHKTDTIFIEKSLIRSYPQAGESLNDYYQTIENAYVIICPFVVADGFTLADVSNAGVIEEMNDEVFSIIVNKLSLKMDRGVVLKIFPSAPAACFEFDPQTGFFTGNLTQFGIDYVRTNLTREILIEYLAEASLDDNTRGTIESVATLAVTGASTTSSRNFRIIK